jgi:tetratricopeptide (TPR) repeat protein
MLLGWGFHYEQAADTAYRLATVMERRGDERWTTIARALLLTYRAELGQPVVAEALAFVDAALERFVAADDDQAVLAVAGAKNLLLHMTARSGPRLETIELLTRAAAALGDDSAAAYADIGALTVALHGPLPVVDDLRRVDQIRDRVAESGSLMLSALIFGTRATLLAYEERLAESLEDAEACLHAAQELTGTARAMLVAIAAEPVAVVGDPSRAEALLRDSVEEFLAVGERGYLASVAPRLGDLCLRRGDHAEAARWAQLTQDITPADDNDAQARWRALAAKLAARAGRLDEAVRLADQAVEYESVSDDLVTHAERFADRAEVMRAAGRLEDEAADLRRALDCYRQKGHRPGLRWIGGRLSPAIPAPGTGS